MGSRNLGLTGCRNLRRAGLLKRTSSDNAAWCKRSSALKLGLGIIDLRITYSDSVSGDCDLLLQIADRRLLKLRQTRLEVGPERR